MGIHVGGYGIGVGRSVEEIVTARPEADNGVAGYRGLDIGQITGNLRADVWNEQIRVARTGLRSTKGSVRPAGRYARTDAAGQTVGIVQASQPDLTVGKTPLPVGRHIGCVENRCLRIPHVGQGIPEGKQRARSSHLHMSEDNKMDVRTSKNRTRAIVDHDTDLVEMFPAIEHGEVEINNGKGSRSREQ